MNKYYTAQDMLNALNDLVAKGVDLSKIDMGADIHGETYSYFYGAHLQNEYTYENDTPVQYQILCLTTFS